VNACLCPWKLLVSKDRTCACKTRSGINSGILISAIIISVLTLNLAHILRTIPESQPLKDGIQQRVSVNCSSIDYLFHSFLGFTKLTLTLLIQTTQTVTRDHYLNLLKEITGTCLLKSMLKPTKKIYT